MKNKNRGERETEIDMSQNPPAAGPFALQKSEPKTIEFIPFGADAKIKLSVKIVQDLICIPTRTGRTCDERDAIKFMMLCQARALNPFEGDCYLQGYEGKNGPEFAMITAHQCFLKRAEVSSEFDGMLSGVRVRLKEDRTVELPGEYYANGEEIVRTDGNGKHISVQLYAGVIVDRVGDFFDEAIEQVCGAWAKVFFKNKKVPMFRALRMAAFNKGYGVWEKNPEGMIVKCAESDALRSSFPTKLGGLYAADELPMKIANAEVLPAEVLPSSDGSGPAGGHAGAYPPREVSVPNETLGTPKPRQRKAKAQEQPPAQAPQPGASPEPVPAPSTPAPVAASPATRADKIALLRHWLVENGVAESELITAAVGLGLMSQAANLGALGSDVLDILTDRYAEIIGAIN